CCCCSIILRPSTSLIDSLSLHDALPISGFWWGRGSTPSGRVRMWRSGRTCCPSPSRCCVSRRLPGQGRPVAAPLPAANPRDLRAVDAVPSRYLYLWHPDRIQGPYVCVVLLVQPIRRREVVRIDQTFSYGSLYSIRC